MPKLDRNQRLLAACFAVVFGMVGLTYASAPLYRMFCQLTGFDGTPLRADRAPGVVLARTIKVRFDANIEPGLPWEFGPTEKEITINVGAPAVTSYFARSNSGKRTFGRAGFNVTPEKAAPYFNKIACFCFDQQTLKPHQAVDMGVTFFISPKISDDPTLNDVDTITLSYTFQAAKGGDVIAAAANN